MTKSTANATRTITYLQHNDTAITQEIMYYSATGEQKINCISEVLLNVAEGDTIDLRTYGLAGNQVLGGTTFNWTQITVEVIE